MCQAGSGGGQLKPGVCQSEQDELSGSFTHLMDRRVCTLPK
jgi:hypothetical protein